MPLRDHFRPPLDEIASWEGFHGGWPMVIVQQLRKVLLLDLSLSLEFAARRFLFDSL